MGALIDPQLKKLYANLLAFGITDYLLSVKFQDFLKINNLDGFWDQCLGQVHSREAIAVFDELNDTKDALKFFLDRLFKKKENFIKIIGEFLNDFKSWSIATKDFSEVKKNLLELGYSENELKWILVDDHKKSVTTTVDTSSVTNLQEEDQQIISLINTLIELGNSVLATQEPLMDPPCLIVDGGLFTQWRTRTLSFFNKCNSFGKGHVYTQSFESGVKSPVVHNVENGLGILRAARSEIVDGPLEITGAKTQGEVLKDLATSQIVISHASEDKYIAKQFLDDILSNCFNIRTVDVLCTSVEGCKIESGDDWRKYIRKKLLNAKVIILLITPNYKSSEICLNEMGAAWATNAYVIPMIAEPVTYDDVGILQEVKHVEYITAETGLDGVKDKLHKILELPENLIPSARWTSKKRDFLSKIKDHLAKNPFPEILSREIVDKLQKSCLELEKEKGTIKNEIEKRVTEKLKKYKSDENTLDIIDKFSKIIQILKPLFQVNNNYSFREVFDNAGKGLEGLHERFINKIRMLENWFWSIQQQMEISYDWRLWLAALCDIIRALEETTRDFGNQRDKWYVDFNNTNMNKLIEEYTFFIQQLKLLYIELKWDEPGFLSLRSLLLGDDIGQPRSK